MLSNMVVMKEGGRYWARASKVEFSNALSMKLLQQVSMVSGQSWRN